MSENIPANIPQDMCRDLYGCEKNASTCPFYKEFLQGTPAAPTEGVADSKEQQAQLQQLRQAAICVEKFKEGNNNKGQGSSDFQRAAFLMSTLWSPDEVLKVSFLSFPPNYPGMQPQWDGEPKRPETTRTGVQSGLGGASCSNDGECQSVPGMSCVNGMCMEDIMPVWYTKEQVFTNMKPGVKLSPEDEELERKVREMDPADAIRHVIEQRIQPLIGVKLEWVDSADGDIRIKLDNRGGAWSYVGNQARAVSADKETMNFGWLDVSTIIHEFCHALGMVHEHQNPYGKGIDWNLRKVYSWASVTQGWDLYTTCQNITKKYSTDHVNGSEYDPESIMLYSYPAWLTNNKVGTYRNIVLSQTDKDWLSAIYPKQGPRLNPSELSEMRASGSSGSSGSSGAGLHWGWIVLICLGVIAIIVGISYYKKNQMVVNLVRKIIPSKKQQ
jgi:hypothetical protein